MSELHTVLQQCESNISKRKIRKYTTKFHGFTLKKIFFNLKDPQNCPPLTRIHTSTVKKKPIMFENVHWIW